MLAGTSLTFYSHSDKRGIWMICIVPEPRCDGRFVHTLSPHRVTLNTIITTGCCKSTLSRSSTGQPFRNLIRSMRVFPHLHGLFVHQAPLKARRRFGASERVNTTNSAQWPTVRKCREYRTDSESYCSRVDLYQMFTAINIHIYRQLLVFQVVTAYTLLTELPVNNGNMRH